MTLSQQHREQLIHGGLGIASEASKVADAIKKVAFHGHPLDPEQLTQQMGGVLAHVSHLCTVLGIALSEVIAASQTDQAEEQQERAL